MPHITRRGKLRYLIHSCLAASLALPLTALAQQEDADVEEVVVTGSYIRNSAFAQNSPVDTVSQVDLFESGAPSISNYIRDLTYTQNTDVVANVLSSQDGDQDAIGASFNLRGLGENSTLTLIDGTRTLSPALSASLPEIAIDRLELVLDGGSALYGSDAVAGVVNIIPMKTFEGVRVRSYYQVTDEPGMESISASALWGKGFDNGLHYVGAFEMLGSLCLFEYTKQFAYSTEEKVYNLYNSLNYEATDWLRFNATLNNSYRIALGRTTSTTAVSGNNREVLLMRADHPANPYGVDVSPWNWRPFTESYTHRPSYIEDSGGSRAYEVHNSLNRARISAEYDLTDTWTGYTYYSKQESKAMNDSYSIHLGKLQLGLAGMGGPNGNEYWNPMGSADPRSPYFIDGVTSNSVDITEWLFEVDKNRVSDRDSLEIFETVLTGELFQLPNPFDVAGWDYNTVVGAQPPTDNTYVSEVRAAFLELQVPLLETLDLQLAVRHEEFKDFGLDATTPKIALRYEPFASVALRASWGESFLAPTPTQARPFIADENCGELFSGVDDMTDTLLVGATVCSSGNPNLEPETSTIQNLGITWEPTGVLDGLSVSLDYQEIEYVDRIRTLTSQDTVANQFNQFLAQSGYTAENYDSTPGSASRTAANAYLASTAGKAGNPVIRYADNSVRTVYTQAANISSVWIDLFDLKTQYSFDTNDWGSFTTTLQTTYYSTYEYEDLFGGVKDALGYQNGNTGIVPPLPKVKTNLRLNWFLEKQSASISANYWHDVIFDDQIVDFYGQGWVAPRKIEGEVRVDARYAMIVDQYLDSEFTISAGITNVFDVRPQRMGILGGFESRLSTPWGRQFWASIEWSPGA